MEDKQLFQQVAQKLIDHDAVMSSEWWDGDYYVQYSPPKWWPMHRIFLVFIALANFLFWTLGHLHPRNNGLNSLFPENDNEKDSQEMDLSSITYAALAMGILPMFITMMFPLAIFGIVLSFILQRKQDGNLVTAAVICNIISIVSFWMFAM